MKWSLREKKKHILNFVLYLLECIDASETKGYWSFFSNLIFMVE